MRANQDHRLCQQIGGVEDRSCVEESAAVKEGGVRAKGDEMKNKKTKKTLKHYVIELQETVQYTTTKDVEAYSLDEAYKKAHISRGQA